MTPLPTRRVTPSVLRSPPSRNGKLAATHPSLANTRRCPYGSAGTRPLVHPLEHSAMQWPAAGDIFDLNI